MTRSWEGTLLGVMTSLTLSLCVGCAGSHAAIAPQLSPLIVVSYNVRNGFDGNLQRREAVVRLLARLRPNIVAFQELNGYTEEQLLEDAKRWGHPHVALLKRRGYPTGLTSDAPLTRIRRLTQDMHHGALVADTHGITVVSAHLSPFNADHRQREVKHLLTLVANSPHLVLAGDLNAPSRRDRLYYEVPAVVEALAMDGPANLVRGRPDYRAVDYLEAAGLVDLGWSRRPWRRRVTAPTILARRHGETEAHVRARQLRIDYIWASASLASRCSPAAPLHRSTETLSDHYPLITRCSIPLFEKDNPTQKKTTRPRVVQ